MVDPTGEPANTFPGVPAFGARESLADVVYSALREAITSGTLAPGYRLRETPLSSHFGVSATPIREALRRLERDGLVWVSPHRGAAVAAFNADEVIALYEVREVLESRAVRRAAEAPVRELSGVDALLGQAEAVLAETDQIQFHRLDMRFHRALNEVGGNVPLAGLAEQIQRRIQGVRARCSVHLPGRPAISHAQHLAIVAAVRDGDPERAEAMVRSHIHSVRDAVVPLLKMETIKGVD